MTEIFSVFFNVVMPVFGIVVLGFLLGDAPAEVNGKELHPALGAALVVR